ncbi:hypothetical protein BYT27DRAFT_6375580 [Phlegmacium glaucopus]|nr:hypothetical protein BYT27DRAFT_6375580 [Phlegmacium glaucopus]
MTNNIPFLFKACLIQRLTLLVSLLCIGLAHIVLVPWSDAIPRLGNGSSGLNLQLHSPQEENSSKIYKTYLFVSSGVKDVTLAIHDMQRAPSFRLSQIKIMSNFNILAL